MTVRAFEVRILPEPQAPPRSVFVEHSDVVAFADAAVDGARVGLADVGLNVGLVVGDLVAGALVGTKDGETATLLQLTMADALMLEPSNASGATYAGSPPSQHTDVSVDMPPKA